MRLCCHAVALHSNSRTWLSVFLIAFHTELRRYAQVAVYAARLLAAMLCMEVFTHTLYFHAIARFGMPRRNGGASGPSALEAGLTGFWVLAFV